MMSRIDPIRRAVMLRRAARPEADQPGETAAEVVRLPIPVDRVNRILPREEQTDGQSAFAAQMMGQDGQKRGLRAGEEVIGAAKILYNRTEWSGSKDRRAPPGGRARTKI